LPLSTQASGVPGILPKVSIILNPAFEKKGWTVPHEEWHFLLDMDFFIKEIKNLTSNFT
jgi:hypothetical protein